MAPGDAATQRAAIADEVVLADEFVQVARAHPRGQRLSLGRRLEQRFGSCAGQPARGWHGWMVARRLGGTGPPDRAGQRVMCATCVNTQSARSAATSVPPTAAIRRTSRAT